MFAFAELILVCAEALVLVIDVNQSFTFVWNPAFNFNKLVTIRSQQICHNLVM